MKNFFPFLFLLTGVLGPLFGEVTFSDLSLAGKNLTFRVESETPGRAPVSGRFLQNMESGRMEALTFLPERLIYLPRTGQIQIQNRFGLFRSSSDFKTLASMNPDSFVGGKPVPEGRILPQAASLDGRFLIYQTPVDLIRGPLVLYEIATGRTSTITEALPLRYSAVPVSWSPDSQFFLYFKNGGVYYFSISQWEGSRIPAEDYRLLGKGSPQSVSWDGDGSLAIVLEDLVYRIMPEQFFTHSLYGGLFRTGTILGKIPYHFDSDKDALWISPDRSRVLLSLRDRSLFLYPLENRDMRPSSQPAVFKPLPAGMEVSKVLWTTSSEALVLSRHLQEGQDRYEVFKVTPAGTTSLLDPQGEVLLDLLLSPERKELAVVSQEKISLRSPQTFKEIKTLATPGTLGAVYRKEGELIVAGTATTSLVQTATGEATPLFFSTLEEVGFTTEGKLAAKAGGRLWTWESQGRWLPLGEGKLPVAATQSAEYRVYLEAMALGPYTNMIMTRDLKAGRTKNMVAYPQRSYQPFPTAEEPRAADLFTHGSRLRKREVTLSIDCNTSSDGLPQVLRALKDHGYKTTFFLNGEFMRRQPDATLEISRSGQETASGFSLWFDMSDPRFKMDTAFIQGGLARNEDDYFNLTGKELTLSWHTPNYFVDDTVIRGGQAAGYTFIGRDVEFLRSRSDEVDILQTIETILADKKPGSIIPLTLGLKDGKTGEGFFKYLDILLNALTIQGYEVVPVSHLKETFQ